MVEAASRRLSLSNPSNFCFYWFWYVSGFAAMR